MSFQPHFGVEHGRVCESTMVSCNGSAMCSGNDDRARCFFNLVRTAGVCFGGNLRSLLDFCRVNLSQLRLNCISSDGFSESKSSSKSLANSSVWVSTFGLRSLNFLGETLAFFVGTRPLPA